MKAGKKSLRRAIAAILLVAATLCVGFGGEIAAQKRRPAVSVMPVTIILPGGRAQETPPKEAEDYFQAMDETNNSFSVDESLDDEEQIKAMKRALKCEKEGRWDRAAREYNSIIIHDSNPLCQMPGIDGERVFVGLKEFSRQRLQKFPPEGIDAYRLTFDRVIKRNLQKARENSDEKAIRLIFINHPISSFADDALWISACILLERGNYHEALFCFRNLITKYPDSNMPLHLAYANMALCARSVGTETWRHIAECVESAPIKLLESDIRVFEEDSGKTATMTLREYLQQTRLALDSHVKSADAGSLNNLSRYTMLEHNWEINNNLASLGYDTAIDDDAMYMSLLKPADYFPEAGLFSFNLRSGKQCPLAQKFGKFALQQHSRNQSLPFISPRTISIDNNMLYYLDLDLNNTATRQNPRRDMRISSTLYACYKDTGKIKWAQPQEADLHGNTGGIPTREARAFMKGLCLLAAPVRYGAYLYTTAIKPEANRNDFYLVCFNANNGALMWRRCLGSETATLSLGWNRHQPSIAPLIASKVTVSNDTIYFSSNTGLVGCANATSGDILWVAKYRKLPSIKRYRGGMSQFGAPQIIDFTWFDEEARILRDVKTFRNGKPATVNIFCIAPRDSECLYGYNADTGARIWERNIYGCSPGHHASRRHQIAFSDRYAFIVCDSNPSDDNPTTSLLVIDLATGKEVGMKFYMPEGERLLPVKPFISGNNIFLLSNRSLLCYNINLGFKLVMKASGDEEFRCASFNTMAIRNDKMLLLAKNKVRCFLLVSPKPIETPPEQPEE